MKKSNDYFIQSLRETLFLKIVPEQYKNKKSAFTRNRKLGFSRLVVCLLQRLYHSLGLEIDRFFEKLNPFEGPQKIPTKSAFCQRRALLKASFFQDAFLNLVKEFYSDNDERIKLWKGYRLLAVDGSKMSLPNEAALRQKYGCFKNQYGNLAAAGLLSACYDVLNRMIIAVRLDHYNYSEKKAALSFLDQCSYQDLLLYDRGYPSFHFIYHHFQRKLQYVMRLKVSHNKQVKAFVDSGETERILKLEPDQSASFKQQPYGRQDTLTGRLIRIELPSGQTEILFTSLLDEQEYPYEIFKGLYHQRWGIETQFDLLKNTLCLENFSGQSENTVLQEIYITVLGANLAALYREEIQQEMDQRCQGRKYKYQVNMSLAIGALRDRLTALLYSRDPTPIIESFKEVVLKDPQPIRPERQVKRQKKGRRVKKKAAKNRKSVL